MSQFVLRKARVEDAPAVLRCVCGAYAHYEERIGKKPAPMLQDYSEVIAGNEVYVTEDEKGNLAGALVLERTEEGLFLDNIAVAPSSQGKGLGRLMLDYAEEAARKHGEEFLYLYTNELMWENQSLYEHFGYELYDKRIVNGYSRVFYRKRVR